MDNFGNTKHRRSRTEPLPPEWGDVKDARRIFGLKENLAYTLINTGAIESVVIRGNGKARGKRLLNFASIRRLLASLAASESQRGGARKPETETQIPI
jgi:hypothetical protein